MVCIVFSYFLHIYYANFYLFTRTPLFESCSYTESEKLEYLQEARMLRQMVADQYRQVVLPSVPLAKKVEYPTWTALGQSLVATYKWISSTDGLVNFIYS